MSFAIKSCSKTRLLNSSPNNIFYSLKKYNLEFPDGAVA